MVVQAATRDEAFHKERQTRLGASDIATIVGCNKYSNRRALWLEKTGRLEPDKMSDAAATGLLLEPSILDYSQQELGELDRDVRVWRGDLDFPLAATLDGRVKDTGEPVNAKTFGLFNKWADDSEWGEAGSDKVPSSYLVQSLVEQYCCNVGTGHVHALIAGRGIVPFKITADSELLVALVEAARRFWIDHIEKDVEPRLEEAPHVEVLKRVRRTAGTSVAFTAKQAAAVDRLEELKTAEKQAIAFRKEAEAEVIASLCDTEGATLPDGRTLTYFEQQRVNKPRLEATVSKFRVLRIKKAPKVKS